MTLPQILDVDPRTLHLPTSRLSGADPFKLQRQIARYGTSTHGMLLLFAYRGSDGALMLSDDVTRATRVAKLLPGTTVRVEVIGAFPQPCGGLPAVGDRIP